MERYRNIVLEMRPTLTLNPNLPLSSGSILISNKPSDARSSFRAEWIGTRGREVRGREERGREERKGEERERGGRGGEEKKKREERETKGRSEGRGTKGDGEESEEGGMDYS